MGSRYVVEHLNHLGIVAQVCREIGVADWLDQQDPGNRQQVSVGTATVAMVLNGLGLSNRRLYLVPQFFADKPIEHLPGPGILAEELNDDCVGRTLDWLYAHDVTRLFAGLAWRARRAFGMDIGHLHADTTSFSVHGQYASPASDSRSAEGVNESPADGEPAIIEVTDGYSRDHREDLKQWMLALVTAGEGVPQFLQPLDGNASDKRALPPSWRTCSGSPRSTGPYSTRSGTSCGGCRSPTGRRRGAIRPRGRRRGPIPASPADSHGAATWEPRPGPAGAARRAPRPRREERKGPREGARTGPAGPAGRARRAPMGQRELDAAADVLDHWLQRRPAAGTPAPAAEPAPAATGLPSRGEPRPRAEPPPRGGIAMSRRGPPMPSGERPANSRRWPADDEAEDRVAGIAVQRDTERRAIWIWGRTPAEAEVVAHWDGQLAAAAPAVEAGLLDYEAALMACRRAGSRLLQEHVDLLEALRDARRRASTSLQASFRGWTREVYQAWLDLRREPARPTPRGCWLAFGRAAAASSAPPPSLESFASPCSRPSPASARGRLSVWHARIHGPDDRSSK